MRVWDQIAPSNLCRQHLLGEHREIHGIWTALTESGAGYQHHPEVKRWRGYEHGLLRRHNKVVEEMEVRGYQHRSPLPNVPICGNTGNPPPLDDQVEVLLGKGCDCEVER